MKPTITLERTHRRGGSAAPIATQTENMNTEIETETEAAPPVDVPRLVLPPGIFKGVPEWSCAAKEKSVAAWLKTLPDAAFFRRGKPKRKPGKRYIHSTCGCWQCDFCHAVILRRAVMHHRRDIWPND